MNQSQAVCWDGESWEVGVGVKNIVTSSHWPKGRSMLLVLREMSEVTAKMSQVSPTYPQAVPGESINKEP